ncbi:MAG TPA: IS110 family transposase [Vicinamibacterales bacterium]|nr:IS110 family transposase [Vicinamibacterales bacterium]
MGRRRQTRPRKIQGVPGSRALPVIRPAVAAVDVGSQEHFVCAPGAGAGQTEVRVFGAVTAQLEAMADWLASRGVESVALESTGVYWIALYDLLESRGMEVLLVNARHLRHVSGRKSDMADCQWLQVLHACGLVRGSHRPGEEIGAIRTVRRHRENLIAQRTTVVQWMQKALDQMNVRVHRAVSDLTGKTGMEIVRAIVAGERDALRLAQRRDLRCERSVEEIAEHLRGTWREEHLFTLGLALREYDHLQECIAACDAQIGRQVRALLPPQRRDAKAPAHLKPAKAKALRRHGDEPLREALWRLTGVDLTRIDAICPATALTFVTEVGLDLSVFPDENHFISWLRLAPFQATSGGRPLRGKKPPKGATYVANALRNAASSLRHARCALGAAFRRTAARHGPGVATFAMARTLAQRLYRMLRYGHDYLDIGVAAYEERFQRRRLLNIQTRAREMGYDLVPIPVAG